MTAVLDPTSERALAGAATQSPGGGLRGHTVALLDISSQGGDVFINRLEELFSQRGCR